MFKITLPKLPFRTSHNNRKGVVDSNSTALQRGVTVISNSMSIMWLDLLENLLLLYLGVPALGEDIPFFERHLALPFFGLNIQFFCQFRIYRVMYIVLFCVFCLGLDFKAASTRAPT